MEHYGQKRQVLGLATLERDMLAEVQDDLQELYAYSDFDDAPPLHRQIVMFASVDAIPLETIAWSLKTSQATVYKVLSHPPIVRELEARRAKNLVGVLDMLENLEEIQRDGITQLLEKIQNKECSTAQLIRIIEMVSDRHPNKVLVKQTKQINEGATGMASSNQLADLRSRAEQYMPKHSLKSTPKRVEEVQEGDD